MVYYDVEEQYTYMMYNDRVVHQEVSHVCISINISISINIGISVTISISTNISISVTISISNDWILMYRQPHRVISERP